MSYIPATTQCRKCGVVKAGDEFRRWRRYGAADREYLRSWCRACDLEYVKQWRDRNPGYHARKAKEYRAL